MQIQTLKKNQTEKIDSVASTAPIESLANIKIVDQKSINYFSYSKK